MTCVANAAQIEARLHARGKSNEQQARGLRLTEAGDDEFALESVGLALREFGWAVRYAKSCIAAYRIFRGSKQLRYAGIPLTPLASE